MGKNGSSFEVFDEQFKLASVNEDLQEHDFFIDYDTCFRASLLTKFYLNQTKTLAGYDPTTDVFVLNQKSNAA